MKLKSFGIMSQFGCWGLLNFFFFKENSVMPATNITIDLLRMEEEMEEHLSAVFHLVLGLA